MANLIKTKFLGDDQVTSEKILLDNDSALRAKNSSGSVQELIKLDDENHVMVYRSTGAEQIAYISDVDGGGQALTDHKNDTVDAHDASAISVSPNGNLGSSDVQSALQELQGDINSINTELDGLSFAASAISVSPTGNLSSSNAQAALEELQGDINTINGKIGSASGIAPLNASSKIDSTYLPSYVDDVLEYSNQAGFPGSGETGKIYVALDTNKTYRWSGSAYIEISPSEVNSVNGKTGVVSLSTSDISEGTNQYFTSARAKSAAVSDSITDGVTDVAPSQNAVYDALALKFDSSSFNGSFDTRLGTKTTDNLTEGTTNKYFTDARAKSASVSDTAYGSGWNGVTDVSPSKNSVYDQMELERARILALESVSPQLYKRTLDATDITNGYIDLADQAVQTNDFHVFVDRLALHQGAGEDYTLSTVSSKTRITFLNQMVSPGNQQLMAGDSIYVRYKK